MQGQRPAAATTAVVVLGASEFPDDPRLAAAPSFRNSAEAFKKYLLDSGGFGLPEQNLLDMFDSPDSFNAIDKRVREFLRARAVESPPLTDVIVYYVGHGGGVTQQYFLALRSTSQDSDFYTSYPIGALARTLKEHARHVRKHLILDCCFSAAALAEIQTGPLEVVVRQTDSEFQHAPGKGTALLAAASSTKAAKAPLGDQYTMFSGALLEVLRGNDGAQGVLSLREVHDRTATLIRKKYQDEGIRPEVHDPDQPSGPISHVPLFPVTTRGRVGVAGASNAAIVDALTPGTFSEHERAIYCVVVTPEAPGPPKEIPLVDHVRRGVEHAGAEIRTEVARYRRTQTFGTTATEEGRTLDVRIGAVHVTQAFRDQSTLERAVEAMCRADVAVFDITGFEPGIMVLLGVRSVARRGVTVCSLGGDYVVGTDLNIPFNLQMLNLAAHSRAQERAPLNPLEIIGQKIVNGFRELADLPFYLDLPAYDSVRRLGPDPGSYRPIPYYHQILALCPFSEEYTSENWERYLRTEIAGKVRAHLAQTQPDRKVEPRLVRLLELATPRLVSQTLFESIRRTDMCLVDWTNLRPNVMYEMGVRLAVNPLGAVHIIEEDSEGNIRGTPGAAQVQQLISMFDPIRYRCAPGYAEPYRRMVDRFAANVASRGAGVEALVYRAVGRCFDHHAHPLALPVVEELVRSADLLLSPDAESSGISPILYYDVNKDLVVEAQQAAADRRLAAWLYMDNRYSATDFRDIPSLKVRFRSLAVLVRRWAKARGDQVLDEYIKNRMQALTRE